MRIKKILYFSKKLQHDAGVFVFLEYGLMG